MLARMAGCCWLVLSMAGFAASATPAQASPPAGVCMECLSNFIMYPDGTVEIFARCARTENFYCTSCYDNCVSDGNVCSVSSPCIFARRGGDSDRSERQAVRRPSPPLDREPADIATKERPEPAAR